MHLRKAGKTMKEKIRRGDRRDGVWVRDADIMHTFLPYIMPKRTDNEAMMSEEIDLAAVEEYVARKNADDPDFKYTFFHVIAAAIAKTVALRPKMNRFYAGDRYYERRDVSLSFVVKKEFADGGDEALAIIKLDRNGDAPIEQIYREVRKVVKSVRTEVKTDSTTAQMGIFLKMPRPLLRFVMRTLRWLDYHGWYPKALMDIDPYYTSVFISNLGSIGMQAQYHHLTNWGTNSFFVIIGRKRTVQPGTPEEHDVVPLGLTIDERIADGYYYSKSIRLLKYLLAHPDLLDRPAAEEVDMAQEPVSV